MRTKLLTLMCAGHVKIHAALVVLLGRGRQVEVGERNFLCMLGVEIPQGLADDCVIVYFLFVLVAENQHRGRSRLRHFFFVRRRRRRLRIEILIALLAHPLFFQALRVHLIGQAGFVLLTRVVRRTRIRPPVWVDSAAEVRISIAPATAVNVAIAPKTVGSQSETARMAEAS